MGLLSRVPPFCWLKRRRRAREHLRMLRALPGMLNALHMELLREEAAWRRSPEGAHLREMIRALGLERRRAGERCFIVGNGPSLNRTDLSRLKGEYSMGMNRIHLLFDQRDWRPSYYVAVNPLVIEQSAAEIARLQMPKFLGLSGAQYVEQDDRTAFVRSLGLGVQGQGFSRDIRRGWWEGATVTYCALQVAFSLGFETVILIGVDHFYSASAKGNPHEEVTSRDADADHFAPDYFGPGFRWNLPDLEWSEYSYQQAREAYEAAGREVLDATVGGKLDVFRKVDFESLFRR